MNNQNKTTPSMPLMPILEATSSSSSEIETTSITDQVLAEQNRNITISENLHCARTTVQLSKLE